MAKDGQLIQKGKAADSIGKMSRLKREIAYSHPVGCLKHPIGRLKADDRLPLVDYPRTYNNGMGIVCCISKKKKKKNSPFPNNS